MKNQLKSSTQDGFSLIVTLLLVILLTVVAVGLLTLSSVSLRSSSQGQAMNEARATARLALMFAIGDLQKFAGPDQRVTASATILGDADNDYARDATPAVGHSHWVGVWDTASFSPSSPDSKTFLNWLVSSKTPGSATSLIDAKIPADTNDVLIFKGMDDASSVKVPKIEVTNRSGNRGAYAYWVEDEGLKANLGWNEGERANADQKQAARLSTVPGPDYAGFEGPFTGKAQYPITKTAGNPWLDNIDKALSMAEMPLVMDGSSNESTWLRDKRHEITLGSRGVLADVKLGGLRRDLSLAFEMDGTADISATQKPTKFNRQVGEFVGGNDRLAAPKAALGMEGVKERFLYRDYQGSGSTFAGDIINANSVIRGPNWWALRDYANLYKRLKGSSGNYSLQARSYYPNVSAANDARYQWGNMSFSSANPWVNTWDSQWTSEGPDNYLFKPARANYAPVLLGSVIIYSVLATNSNGITADLAVGIDPFFYLWNPYNRTLKIDKYALKISGFGGHVTLWVDRPDGSATQHGPTRIINYIRNRANAGGDLSYLASDLTMNPGEVIVVSPRSNRGSSANEYHDAVFPGTHTDNLSGAILDAIPDENGKNWKTVKLNLATDNVGFLFSFTYDAKDSFGGRTGDTAGAEQVRMDASLPAADVKPVDLADPNKVGEHLQQIGNNTQGDLSVPEYFDPPRQAAESDISGLRTGTAAANTLADTKRFFGICTYLTKPAAHQGEIPNPVEVFTQFNPFPMAGFGDMWRPCLLSQTFSGIADPGDVDSLLQRAGINFPAARPMNGYWGESYASGSTAVPLIDIPSSPILSLASFSHANLSIGAMQPFRAVGNSWSSLFVSPVSPYGRLIGLPASWEGITGSDSSWLLNDALFDRYFLSGIAPEFTLAAAGYSSSGSLSGTLARFFSTDPKSAQASPVLRPYLPPGTTPDDIVTALAADDGYKKMGAYSLVDGAFNVNSTSASAWAAFLRGNRNLEVNYAQGAGTDSASGTPFPSGSSPALSPNAAAYWSGVSRLNESQINDLASALVKQVKLRGPFMSLSDFINHRVGTPKKNETHYMGALQAAIEDAGINSSVRTAAGGVSPVYSGLMSKYFPDPPPTGSRTTTTGIPGDITQANLLLPLAPRLTARSDTFRIRSYGEALSPDGAKVLAKAVCEAVVQRVPQYVDPDTDATNNEPWDEATNPLSPSASKLNQINQKFGRRFKIVQFRWLSEAES